jgi:glycosyltransferase involved in cell wall biosynthesis
MSLSVLTSHVEGFPNVILESMVVGTPVVAAKVGGISDLIEDGVTGSLIPTRNPNDFAEVVDAMLSDTECSAAMTERAQERRTASKNMRRRWGVWRTTTGCCGKTWACICRTIF